MQIGTSLKPIGIEIAFRILVFARACERIVPEGFPHDVRGEGFPVRTRSIDRTLLFDKPSELFPRCDDRPACLGSIDRHLPIG